MRALAVVHQRHAGPGVFTDVFEQRGWELVEWLIAEDQDPPCDPLRCDAVLTFGGAMHADQESTYAWLGYEKALLAQLLSRGVPLLGVCLGAQLLADAAGTPARRTRQPEIGWFDVAITRAGVHDPVIGPLAPGFSAFEWHSYEAPLPDGALALARSSSSLQAYRLGDRAWGIQFHAEVTAADVEQWIVDYRTDEDAVRLELDWMALSEQTRAGMPAWNHLGRGLCDRFLEAATRG